MVGKGTSGGECYGTYNSSTGIGSGAVYVNSCIYSGSNDYTDGPTVWYNYVMASADTIKNSSVSDTTGNMDIATESICPKNWTLPTTKQMNSNRDILIFSPNLGGVYYNGTLYNESIHSGWWGSQAENSARRHALLYEEDILKIDYYGRRTSMYIRCVSEEKDVSDLTYMQDMTPSILQELCVIVNVLRA